MITKNKYLARQCKICGKRFVPTGRYTLVCDKCSSERKNWRNKK